MLLETRFLSSLLFTLVIEIPILFIFVKYIFKNKKLSLNKIIGTGIIASVLTLPYLWFILPPYVNTRNYLLIGESLVIFVEALIYFSILDLNLKKAFIVSLIANIISFFIGFYLIKF